MNSRRGFFTKFLGAGIAGALTLEAARAIELPETFRDRFLKYLPEATAVLRTSVGVQYEASSVHLMPARDHVCFHFSSITGSTSIDEFALLFAGSPSSEQAFYAGELPGLPFIPNGGDVDIVVPIRFVRRRP